jgi:D-psicose/D-tagatose/L-ribulose 3-epimerase
MMISAMLTSLPLEFGPAVEQAAALGFSHIDVVALAERPAAHREALADAGLLVSCAAVGRGLPEGQTLDAVDAAVRRAALDAMRRQVADAAALGATHCYVIPGMDASADGLLRFAETCALLADYAGQRMVRLCVEHIPGRALPTAAGTLAWLETVGHANLGLLLDVGHCLLSGEDAARVVSEARARLGYVHFDDNDGQGDLHWPLLTGRLTEENLRAVLDSLRMGGYGGALALELAAVGADPVRALWDGKKLLEQLGEVSAKR